MKTDTDTPLLLSQNKTAMLLGVSRSTVKRLVISKRLPIVWITKDSYRIARKDIDAFVANTTSDVQ